MLEKRILGKTGLEVSRLALGGLFISDCAASRQESCNVIKRAWELGINYIDTAPSYHDSEDVLGEALHKIDADFIVSTKIGNLPASSFHPQDKSFLKEQLERSFQRLNRQHVNILMIHEPDRPTEFYDWWSDKNRFEGPVLDLLREYRDAGHFEFIGLGGTTVTEMSHLVKSGKFDILLTAFQYSLLYQEAGPELIPSAKKENMGVIAGSPLQQGAFSSIFRETLENNPPRWMTEARRKQFLELYDMVEDYHLPLAEVALRFVLSNPAVDTVLTGARSVEEIERNVEAAERGPLPEEMLLKIREIYMQVPYRPYGEPIGVYPVAWDGRKYYRENTEV